MYKPRYVKSILFTEKELNEAVIKAAKWIDKRYPDPNKPLVMVCVLKGAVVFFTSLLTKIEREVIIDFTTLSSYRGTVQTLSEPKIITNLSTDVADKDVVIIEDIADTANTLTTLIKNIKSQNPCSISCVVLIDKPDCRVKEFKPDYACLSVKGNPFIIGYGIDVSQHARNLPYIAEFDKDYKL